MRISFTEAALNDAKWFPAYDVLTILVENDRHGFDPLAIPLIYGSDWIAARPVSLRDVIRRAALARSNVGGRDRSCVLIDTSVSDGGKLEMDKDTARLSPLDAIAHLSSPFHVIVENEVFDGAFLLWMAKAAGFPQLLKAYRDGVFVFRHAGGKDSFPRSAEVLSAGVVPNSSRTSGRTMRLWAAALLDSDSKYPGHNPNRRLIEQTQDHVTFVRQLRKRSIENYIPDHYLGLYRTRRDHQRKVSAFRRLDEKQRTHYHMKVGFRHDKAGSCTKVSYMASGNPSAGEKALYSGIAENDFQSLGLGFGEGLSDIFRRADTRASANDKHLTSSADRAEVLDLCRSLFERF